MRNVFEELDHSKSLWLKWRRWATSVATSWHWSAASRWSGTAAGASLRSCPEASRCSHRQYRHRQKDLIRSYLKVRSKIIIVISISNLTYIKSFLRSLKSLSHVFRLLMQKLECLQSQWLLSRSELFDGLLGPRNRFDAPIHAAGRLPALRAGDESSCTWTSKRTETNRNE